MTKQDLMALLRDPNQTGQSVDELNRLIEENPYFHTGHQLYLKGLQQTNEQKMALQLGKSALSVRDRNVLYNYLNSPSSFRQEPSVSPEQPEIQPTFVPGSTFVLPPTDIHDDPPATTEPSLLQQSSINTGGEWQNTEEQTIVEEKIMSSEQLMEIVRRQLEQISSPHEEGKVVEEKGDLDLIDSFLKTNPKIIPDENRTYQVDLLESLQENPDNQTETLADIYARQGYKDKAIEIYEQLFLKYPEKHIYFAAQIERLKE
jgi:tetratricopeptide (TPR) repeat protein